MAFLNDDGSKAATAGKPGAKAAGKGKATDTRGGQGSGAGGDGDAQKASRWSASIRSVVTLPARRESWARVELSVVVDGAERMTARR